MTAPSRLFGLSGSEILFDSPQKVWEHEILPWVPYNHGVDSWVVEEWSVIDPIDSLPDAPWILDMIDDWTGDTGGYSEEPFGGDRLTHLTDVWGAAEALRYLIASKVVWHQADDKLGEHLITLTDTGEPLFDGQPLTPTKEPT